MIIEPKTYGSEAGHWYFPDGRPCHQVPYRDKKRVGELRNTTLIDAREMGLYPSVSGILKIQSNPGLDNWKKEQVARSAWENFEKIGNLYQDQEEDAVRLILSRSEENMTRARDLGTEIHGAIERYLSTVEENDWESMDPSMPHGLAVNAAGAALKDMGVWGQPFEAERTFASPLGYGGTIDFRANWIFADFKCVDSLDKKLDYPDRCSQLCAYGVGGFGFDMKEYNWTHFKLANIFISTSEPGKYLIHEWSQKDKEHGWKLFRACQNLWEISNNYYPSRETSGTATQ
jgi:hypothetical protein